MFNRTSFDKTVYDRSSSTTNYVEATLRGSSKVTTNIQMQVYMQLAPIKGSGSMTTTLIAKQNLSPSLSGSSTVIVTTVVLILVLKVNIKGSGSMDVNLSMRTPLAADIHATSTAKVSTQMYIIQNMYSVIYGKGKLNAFAVFNMTMSSRLSSYGNLNMDNRLAMLLPMSSTIKGSGTLLLRRIEELDTDTMELANLNLAPGQTIIIDTDSLDVFINNIPNVDTVTSDSIFFQLQPGDNEVTINSDGGNKFDVVAITQNRWL